MKKVVLLTILLTICMFGLLICAFSIVLMKLKSTIIICYICNFFMVIGYSILLWILNEIANLHLKYQVNSFSSGEVESYKGTEVKGSSIYSSVND